MSAPEHPADVREWLRRALDDLRWAEHSRQGGFLPQACFCCQQAAEKALKAYALAWNLPLKRTHSLPELLKDLRGVDVRVDEFRDTVTVLDVYYAPNRYADVLAEVDYTPARVEDALRRAGELVDWLRTRTESRLGPT